MTKYKGIRFPTSGVDWQLYTCSMKCGAASRALVAALKQAFRFVEKNFGKMPVTDLLAKADHEIVGPVRSQYSSFGAADTEPRNVAHQALIDFAKIKLYGTTKGYFPELGDKF